jgi:hypothetical protein
MTLFWTIVLAVLVANAITKLVESIPNESWIAVFRGSRWFTVRVVKWASFAGIWAAIFAGIYYVGHDMHVGWLFIGGGLIALMFWFGISDASKLGRRKQ